MSVEIEPAELGFRRPFTVEVAQVLKIKNTNSSPVAFKVKTTAPKQYCVRPNSGRIEPGHDVEVSVLLQAMKQEPPADARCRDKFLVQSCTITGDKEFTNVAQIWDSTDRSAIQEKKIRVTWLAPTSSDGHLDVAATPVRQNLSNGVESTPDAPPPAYSSPQEEAVVSSPPATQHVETRREPSHEPETAPSTIVPSVAAVKATVVDTYEDLKSTLAQKDALINSLKDQLSSGIKQRKPAATASDEKSTTPGQALAQVQPRGTEGVPVQIVALLCLLSFLLAYFFF
ncbi:vesicle-associated protein 2-2 [Podospora conica]|nr:vesicle-associated protein 2-2 [Schizothecium conicum]